MIVFEQNTSARMPSSELISFSANANIPHIQKIVQLNTWLIVQFYIYFQTNSNPLIHV